MKTLLVTGAAGFIGANFVQYYVDVHPQDHLVLLDALTYAANPAAWANFQHHPRLTLVNGRIEDESLLTQLFQTHRVEGVIHFAAESHVDNSIADPMRFVKTNVLGTGVLLEVARRYWTQTNQLTCARFHHVSTDEVYGALGDTGYFTETTPYQPNSPYSASKAGSDHLVRAYHHTYGMNVTISNCSNNYGPWQHDEKLIPTIIRRALAQAPIPIYGTGLNVRDWLWVGDHCQAIDMIFHQAQAGQTFNVGGHQERTNLEVAQQICQILDACCPSERGAYARLITMVKDRAGHDFRYAIDSQKIRTQLGWQPSRTFEAGLQETVRWYLERGFAT